MLLDYRNEDNYLVIQLLEKRLDAAAAIDFKSTVLKEYEENSKNIVIDLDQVDFIDSSGLGALVSILKSVQVNQTLAITGLNKKTEQIFKLTRMDTIFKIYPSVGEALEAA